MTPSPALQLELDLEPFAGPFDLLLALVLRDVVDLGEVPVADVCLRYLAQIEEDGEIDLESASEFIVLVASLLELKIDRKSTRLNSSHVSESRMPSSA